MVTIYVLVTITDEKIRVELSHIEGNLTGTLCSVHTAEDAELLACGSQTLEWHAHTGLADDGVENGDFDCIAGLLLAADCRFEEIHKDIVGDGVGVVDLHRFSWCRFTYILNSLPA